METWGTLLTDIRADLQDTSSQPRWSNDMLYVYTKDAIRDYSTWFPRRVDRLAMTPAEGRYALPMDFIEDIQVECPLDTFLERRLDRPGAKYLKSSLYYFIQGGSLYLAGTPLGTSGASAVYLTYLASHPVPASAGDPAFELTIPDSDIELVRLFVKAKVFGQMRQRQAALDRFKVTGERTDNPIEPEVHNLWGEYYSRIAQRIPGGVISLYRAGRVK